MEIFIIFLILIDCFSIETKIISTFKPIMIQTDNDPETDEYIFTIENKHYHIILTESEFNKYETHVSFDGNDFIRINHQKRSFMEGRFANNPKKNIYLRFNNGIHGLLPIANTTLEIMPLRKYKNKSELKFLRMTMQNKDHNHIAILMQKTEKYASKSEVKMHHLKNSYDRKMKNSDPLYSLTPSRRDFTSIIPLSVAVLAETFEDPAFGNKDKQNTIDKVLEIVYSTNIIFRAINIIILCGYIEIFTDNSIMPSFQNMTTVDMVDISTKILRPRYKKNIWYWTDTMVFSKYMDYPEFGRSNWNSFCGDNALAVIKVQDIESMAITISHELGHHFNIVHSEDNYYNLVCFCEQKCLMNWAQTNDPLDDLTWNYCDYNKLRALVDKPCMRRNINFNPLNKIYCGNNVIDPGEDCDCGLPSDCAKNNLIKICDPFACKFHPPCDCIDGICCKDCKIQAINSTCPLKNNECQIGICIGKPDICQPNGPNQNGTRCNKNQDYCFNGTCLKHGSRCADIYGKDAVLGNDSCFQYFNSRNNQSGNCGYNSFSKTFIPCSTTDLSCGLLACNTKINSYVENETTIEVNSNNCTVKYTTLVKESFSNILSVYDGIPCDTNKICWFNKCMTEEEISEEKICGQYSTLSNQNECICNDNYAQINNLCFLKKPSSNGILAIIVIMALFGAIILGSFTTFLVLRIKDVIFNSKMKSTLPITTKEIFDVSQNDISQNVISPNAVSQNVISSKAISSDVILPNIASQNAI